jgi:hypothetical protein
MWRVLGGYGAGWLYLVRALRDVAAMTIRQLFGLFLCLTLPLAGCASRAPVASLPPVQSSVDSSKAILGVIAAIRPVQLAGPQGSIQFGVNGVLSALQQNPSSGAASATEFVIQRNDATTAAIVMPASALTGNFTIGERVEIIDGAEPVLIAGN